MSIALLASTASNAEASQIIGTINGVIQDINENALIGASATTSLRNAVIGGDFGTNPWQRGTSFTGITSTAFYTADRFFGIGGASSSISISRQTTTPPPGFAAVARFGRASSNADVDPIKFGQVFTSANSTRFQGQPFVLSFYARAGATYSPASSALGITVATGTGSDETTANYAAGSWTGYAAATLYGSAGTAVTSVTLTTSFARYSVSGVIPTGATQIGFNISMTPVGTAGATDYVELTGVQFEVMPQGGVQPTPFEALPASLVRSLCYAYYWRLNETGTGAPQVVGVNASTSTARFLITFPVPMRTTPTVNGGADGSTTSIGSLAMVLPLGTTATTTLTLITSSGTPNGISALGTCTVALTSGGATMLVSGGGAGFIAASGEL